MTDNVVIVLFSLAKVDDYYFLAKLSAFEFVYLYLFLLRRFNLDNQFMQKQILSILIALTLGLCAFAKSGNISLFHYDASTGLPQIALSGITQDSNGNMWFSSTKCGLFQYNGDNALQLSKEPCYSVFTIKDTIVAGFQSGLMIRIDNKWTKLNDEIITDINYHEGCFVFSGYDAVYFWKFGKGFVDTASIPHSTKSCLTFLDNILYISTYSGELLSCNFNLTPKKTNKLCHSDYAIQSINKGNNGELLVSTMGGGLKKLVDDSGKLEATYKTLISDCVQCSIIDNENNLWIGTREGMTVFDSSGDKVADIKKEFGVSSSLSHNSIKVLYVDIQGGVWIGTYYGGIDYYHPLRSRFHTLAKGNNEVNLNDCIIGCISEAPDGSIWIGTNSGGINRYDRKSGIVKKIVFNNDLDYCKDIKAIHFSDNKVFIGTHGMGMYLFDTSSHHLKHLNTTTNVAYIDQVNENSLIYGTEECEYFTYDLKTDISSNYDTVPESEKAFDLPGLESFTLIGKEQDCSGNCWVSTSNGLLRYNPVRQTYSRYTTLDGLASDYFITHAHCKASDGVLFFGGIGGVTYFNPEDFTTVFESPSPFVRDITINGIDKIDNCQNNILKIPSKCKQLAISFAVSDYIWKGQNSFEYMLDGFDDRWWKVGSDNRAVFAKLPKGLYRLKIKAVIGDGIPSVNNDALVIRVYPPWYATSLGIVVEFLSVACIIYLIIRLIIRQKSINNELKLKRLEERHQHEIIKLKALKVLNTDININNKQHYDRIQEVPPEYELFFYTLIGQIEENISNPELSTELLSQKMKMNRITLYKKIKAATGGSALKLIHKVRFMEACKMLQEGKDNVSEICYKLGFANPANFATAFKKEVGCSPSEYVVKMKYIDINSSQNSSAT